MEIDRIDNTFRLSQTILWQYDHAPNLIGMFAGMDAGLKTEVTDFWDWFVQKVGNVDELDYFGLNVWGITLGIPRPFIPHGQIKEETAYDDDGNELHALSNEVYCRLLKARMYMLDANASAADISEGLKIAFEGRVVCIDGYDMTISVTNNFIQSGNDFFYCFVDSDGNVFYSETESPQSGSLMRKDANGVLTVSGTTYDEEAMTRFADGDVAKVVGADSSIIEPSSEADNYAVRMEEFDLLSNPDVFESVFPFPSGVKTNGEAVSWKYAIGLNDDQEYGQKLRNFAPKHADIIDDSVNGGQFAISEEGPWQTE